MTKSMPMSVAVAAVALPWAALVLATSGCLEDDTIRVNAAPTPDAGKDQLLDSAGAPVSVRLDGRKSSDVDGEIVKYIWRNAVAAGDGGAEWATGALDPADRARPELELDQGNYSFLLWVVDDGGA